MSTGQQGLYWPFSFAFDRIKLTSHEINVDKTSLVSISHMQGPFYGGPPITAKHRLNGLKIKVLQESLQQVTHLTPDISIPFLSIVKKVCNPMANPLSSNLKSTFFLALSANPSIHC